MPTLPPTVHERLAACNTRVFVTGMVPGADVELEAGSATVHQTATGGSRSVTVPELSAGDVVRARQDAGAGFSEWSPEVVVEDVALPPNAPPRLPTEVGLCSHCVEVRGLVPGCDVELLVGPQVIGSGTARRDGTACLGVEFRRIQDEGALLRGRMTVCGQQGPDGTTSLVDESLAVPDPTVLGPLFGCQTVVPLDDVRPGARVRLRTEDGDALGSFCSCWERVDVDVGVQLGVGDVVQAQAYWAGEEPCRNESDWSPGEPVVPPDERIRPTVRAPLNAGDEYVRVEGQIEGSDLVVEIRPDGDSPAESFGPRPASDEEQVGLAAPLEAGNVVSVVQTLCGVSMESDPVTVRPAPPEVHPPVIVPPLYECASAVQVSNLYPGAFVRLYQDGIPVGQGWAGDATSLTVETAPSLVADSKVTARQWVGSVESDPSEAIQVRDTEEVLPPVVLEPVAVGDREVWVSQVTPGARVTVVSAVEGEVVGEANASEPVVRVPVSPVSGPVFATARLCDATESGDRVRPVIDPGQPGRFSDVADEFADYGYVDVPAGEDNPGFEAPVKGQLYYPADPRDAVSDVGLLPVVIIAHGYWTGEFDPPSVDGEYYYWNTETEESELVDSYRGYDYLARHLASWGALVFSLHLDYVNHRTSTSTTHLDARGEVVLEAVERVVGDPEFSNYVDDTRVGLVGHSMGGEGVVVAQHLNERDGRGVGVRGVVSIAPTNHRPEVPFRGASYLQLLGSMDLLLSTLGPVTGEDATFSGFRIYDRAWRPKSHAWIYGARHNPFNRRWVGTTDDWESDFAADERVISDRDHEQIARSLINAFFRDTLGGQSTYGGYLEGTILPESLPDVPVFLQHSSEVGRAVVDNFGDEDDQAGLPETALERGENSLGEPVAAEGDGLVRWEDVEHVDLAHSPHGTKGLRLAWEAPAAEYTSGTGGLSHGLDEAFSLRAAQFYPDEDRNLANVDLDLFVQVGDGSDEATVRLGAVHTVPYPHDAHERLSVLRTVRLPLNAFRAVNDDVDLGGIRVVRLLLNGQFSGHVLADDLEFSH